jgi:3-phosphoshikimate 1-carboxyvinyltransferase
MIWVVRPATIGGAARVPGDKSVSHRALMLAALAPGTSSIRGIGDGADVCSTAGCLRDLGVRLARSDDGCSVESDGILRKPEQPLDAGNSGTTMRLLAGILAGQPFASSLTGDASLSARPMARVIEPLQQMGARILSSGDKAPLTIEGGSLRGIAYTSQIASAQVKSCVLLAGLFAEGTVSLSEPYLSRDHTERMFKAAGIEIDADDRTISLRGDQRPRALDLTVPGDISSAAFLFAMAVLTGGNVTVDGVGINPTRVGFLDVLERMGATVTIAEERLEAGEPVAEVSVCGPVTEPVQIEGAEIPRLVDELPLVVLLATQAPGRSIIRGAAELRVKESDRVSSVARQLNAMGAKVTPLADGFEIQGGTRLRGTTVSSGGDHRLAMMLSAAGCIARGETTIEGAEAATVSFPGFAATVVALGGRLDVA